MIEKADSLSFKFRDIVEFSAYGNTGIGALLLILLVFSLCFIGFAVGRHLKMW